MQARGMQFGPLTLPALEAQYAFALTVTMQTYSLHSDFVDKRSQDTMLNTLFIQCVQNVEAYFQACTEYYNPETDVEKWAWWTSQNDAALHCLSQCLVCKKRSQNEPERCY
jgi:hypothetical protein